MLRQRLGICLLLGLLLQGSLVVPYTASAQSTSTLTLPTGFDPNHVLEDDDIFDVNGMTYQRLVDFLNSKGTLATTKMPDIDGVVKPIPDIIWRVAQSYKINPKYLLALMEKEQSLVTDPDPSQGQFDWATGYGVCDSCSKDDPSIEAYKGFAAQLEWAGKQFREKYLLQILGNGSTKGGDAPGKPLSIDGLTVTPVNDATAMLYAYTPHLHGNENLWKIWRQWFTLTYPDGTVVQGEPSGSFYLIRLGEKRAFSDASVAASMVDLSKVVTASDSELAAYPDGDEIQFPLYALLKDEKGQIWLLTDTGRRHITSMAAFKQFGFNSDEIVNVKSSDLADYPVGTPITTSTQFPQGVLAQDTKTKQYWYIDDTTKQLVPNAVFINLYFQGRRIHALTTAQLAKYKTADNYEFHDGELVRGKKNSSVYVVQAGTLRPIPSAEVFEAMGWKWNNVVTVPDALLTGYQKGDPITLDSPVGPDDTILTLL